jgi:SPP1 family predicted phage head-tail adaptor
MRETINIQKNVSGKDTRGNPVDAWQDYYSCHAYVNELSGREFYEAREVHLENTVVFIVRYTPKLKDLDTSSYRLVFRSRIYDITFVDNPQFRNEMLKISAICREGNLDG